MTARIAEVSRKTAETQITVKVNLDGTGRSNLHTGIGLYIDWMRRYDHVYKVL